MLQVASEDRARLGIHSIPKANALSIIAVAAFAVGLIVAGMFIAGTMPADAAEPGIGESV
jgi:hypothetical protein